MSRRTIIKGVGVMFFVVAALLLASCQSTPSQPMGSTPIVPDVGEGLYNSPAISLPIVESKAVQSSVEEISDSFPVAKNLFTFFSEHDFVVKSVEKDVFWGSWLNGEGVIGAVRFDHKNPKKPGLWMVVGRGQLGNTVTVLIPVDEKESAYYIYVRADSLASEDFVAIPFLLRSDKYGSYVEFTNSRGGGGWGIFAGFFGDMLGQLVEFEISTCLACRDAAYNAEDAILEFKGDLQHTYRNMYRYANCCDDFDMPTLPPVVDSWFTAGIALGNMAPPAVAPCGPGTSCYEDFRDWGDYYDNALISLSVAQTKWNYMLSVCAPCLFRPGMYHVVNHWFE